jgi:hypothetical protein
MFLWDLDKKLQELQTKKKAVIALGCSFVQGQGAWTSEFVKKNSLNIEVQGNMMMLKYKSPELAKQKTDELLLEYTSLIRANDEKRVFVADIDFSAMENENSFVEVLCRRYMPDYVPLNFGMRGNGNRATIMQLFRFPEINFSELEDIVVLFLPSGLERFDFASQRPNGDHFTHITVWPHWESEHIRGTTKDLWKGYAFDIFSDYSTLFEYLDNVNVLETWCKLHKASLFIFPAFTHDITKENFRNIINSAHPYDDRHKERNLSLVDSYPWEKHIELNGTKTFSMFTNLLENGNTRERGYWHNFGKGSPNGYWSKCAHPTDKAHAQLAKHLYGYIKNAI